MDELERALRAVLDDPAQLGELRALAGTLGLGQPPEVPEPPKQMPQPEPPEMPDPPVQAAPAFAPAAHGGGHTDKRQQALLLALKPFLRPERQEKLERALQAARLADLAGFALRTRHRRGEP